MSEFQTFKYLFLGEGFTCSEAAWTYGKGCSVAASHRRHRPKVLRDLSCFDAALKPQILGMKVLGTDASSSCKTQHDTTRKIFLPWGIFMHFCSFQHQQEVICESLSYPRYFLIYCAWKGNKPQVNPEIMLPGFVSGAFQDFTNFYSNRTAGFAPVLVT